MSQKEASSPKMNLVKNTDFEKFLLRIRRQKEKKEQKEQKEKEEELKLERKCDVIKSICSVYEFALGKLKMEPGPISVKEFEVVENELIKLATSEVKARKISKLLGRKTIWHYYLEHGYFSVKARPFGNRIVYDDWMIERFYDAEEFLDRLPRELDNSDDDDDNYIPTNFNKLYRSLLKKRGTK